MRTPAAALAWELWRKHRKGLMIIVGLLLAFALVYPKLCALAGINPFSPDASDEFGMKLLSVFNGGPWLLRLVRFPYILFLADGPRVVMILSLLYVIWMFTFTEFDPKTKNPMSFPARLFTLPVSTPFLFWCLWLAGMAAVVLLYGSWIHFVRPPQLEAFGAYQNCFCWMTALALVQAIVWALAYWPGTRMLLLIVVLFGFVISPDWSEVFDTPIVLPPIFALGVVLARVGLQKMRHGQWQGWNWKRTFPAIAARKEWREPKRFASPAQAQLWFEWRWFARGACFAVASLALVPLVILLVRLAAGLGPLQFDTLSGFAGYLVIIPLFTHFCLSMSSARTDQPFLLIHPLTNGEMLMATLKAAAISTVVSWVVVLAALGAMPLLGNFCLMEQSVSVFPQCRAAIVLILIFLTWRLAAGNLCLVLSGSWWLAGELALVPLAIPGGMIFFLLAENSAYWDSLWRLVPGLLAGLVIVKFLLAYLAFRVSIQRGLIASSSVVGYLVVWFLLAGALLIPTLILFHGKEWILPASLGLVLLVPLARIGFCPIALARSRHA